MWYLSALNITFREFRKGRHLCLAGRNAGDLHCMEAIGVPLNQVTAVDVVESAAASAKLAFPTADIRHCDALDVVRSSGRVFRSMFMDFCGPMTDERLAYCVDLIRYGSLHASAFTVAFLRGREKSDVGFGEWSRRLNSQAKVVKGSPIPESWRISTSGHYPDGKRANKLERNPDSPTARGFIQRVGALQLTLQHTLGRHGISVFPYLLTDYVSNTESSKGVPMMVCQFYIHRHGNAREAVRYTEKLMQKVWTKTTPEPPNDEAQFREWVLRETDAHPTRAEMICRGVQVSPGTLAAWRAHRTRGTYDEHVSSASV